MVFSRAKLPKSQQPDKAPFTLYTPAGAWTNAPGGIQVCSIDPAGKNFALRVERWLPGGRVIPLAFEKADVRGDAGCGPDPPGAQAVCTTYGKITALFEAHTAILAECHVFIIERQLPHNYRACRIAQHTLSYFILRYADGPLHPTIVEVDPKLKGRELGAPKGLTERQLKSWAVDAARARLAFRGDAWSLWIMDRNRRKQDDLADTVCQIEALFALWGIAPPTSAPMPPPTSFTLAPPPPPAMKIRLVISGGGAAPEADASSEAAVTAPKSRPRLRLPS